jgi:uncharacterized protein YccT (UPF0319 family)
MIVIVKYYNENITDIEIMGVYRNRKEAKKWIHKIVNHDHKNGKKVSIHDDVVLFDDGIMYRIEKDLWVL